MPWLMTTFDHVRPKASQGMFRETVRCEEIRAQTAAGLGIADSEAGRWNKTRFSAIANTVPYYHSGSRRIVWRSLHRREAAKCLPRPSRNFGNLNTPPMNKVIDHASG